MASAWGEVSTYMTRWYGSGVVQNSRINILPPAPVPPVFNPLDISDCALWLDANDSSTIQVSEDLSGANVNRVMKWFDKAKPANNNYFTHDGDPSTSGLYNTTTMNFLNTVSFPVNCAMDHSQNKYQFNFVDRTFFAVIKPRVVPDVSNTVLTIFSGDVSGGMTAQIFYDVSNNNYKYGMYDTSGFNTVAFDLSENPLNTRMILMWAHGKDLSGNVGSYDVSSQPLTINQAADYSEEDMDYFLSSKTEGCSFDVGEILMYGRVLDVNEQTKVLEYLADKWNLSGPNPETSEYLARQNVPYSGGVGGEPAPPIAFPYTYIIYTQFPPDAPNFYWCDEFGNVESPPVLAQDYDGTTALRDGLAVVVSGVLYP